MNLYFVTNLLHHKYLLFVFIITYYRKVESTLPEDLSLIIHYGDLWLPNNTNNSRLLFWAKSGTESSQFNPTVLQ
jgi:hypothetical protein